MEVAWGEALSEETQGLDILGIRGLDQSLETALANGITTISLRGRYFTILPWLIGEFFEAEKNADVTEFAEDRLRIFAGRVEYLTLACTMIDDSGGNSGGVLGSVTFRDTMAVLRSGVAIPFPKDRAGSILGTYFGPCRAIGLVKTETSTPQPFSLTPRGMKVWEVRKAALGDDHIPKILWNSDILSPDDVRAAVPHFSLMGLKGAEAEAACLRDALDNPWAPAGGGTAVTTAYEKFAGTVAWLREEAKSRPLRADTLLADNYRRIVGLGGGSPVVRTAWAEFEWRRRLHFALELMFGAVCFTLRDRGEATLAEVVTEWREATDLPSALTAFWPEADLAWERTSADAVASVPADAYLDAGPNGTLNSVSPHAKAITAFGLVTVLASQSRALRAACEFPDRAAVGERALAIVEGVTGESFQRSLQRLAEIAVQAHLTTTFRKMAGGQKCSLRFFPEGNRLCTTRLQANAGQSGTRLWNIIRVLADAGADGIGDVV